MKDDLRDAEAAASPARRFHYSKPTKEAVRAWLRRVIASKKPPPEIDDIQGDLWYVPRSDGLKDES